MTIAITGATGQLGRNVIDELKKQIPTGQIVALARSPEKAAGLGVTVRPFDYTKPEELVGALDGVDTLLLISASDPDQRTAQIGRAHV